MQLTRPGSALGAGAAHEVDEVTVSVRAEDHTAGRETAITGAPRRARPKVVSAAIDGVQMDGGSDQSVGVREDHWPPDDTGQAP